ncbi:MAG: PKD domain-containing protein [Thermoplasmatota archaeon]
MTRLDITKRNTAFALLTLLVISSIPFVAAGGGSSSHPIDPGVKSFRDLDFSDLESLGYRPQLPYPGAETIQTPEPIPEDAVYPPVHPSLNSLSSSQSTRATWDKYYEDDILTVYVDVSSGGGGQLSSNEQQLLDRIISDFVNFSFPRVKDYYDPLERITNAIFQVHQIDGPSGTGGYYSPGSDDFHVDRADLSWAGVITAHEFEHYVHRQYDPYENLWIDEGSADYAAYLVYGISSATAGHLYAYLEYRPYYGLVVSDTTFYQDGTTAYYGVSYLYQLYMTYQYGGKNWTRALVRQTQRGIYGVNRALSSLGYSEDFDDSFGKWMVASRFNDGGIGEGQYEFGEKSYGYGTINMKLWKTHSGIPISGSKEINGYSNTIIRFTSPPGGWDDFRLKMTFSNADPIVALYPETSTNRDVIFLEFNGGRSITYDFSGWGSKYDAFQMVVSGTGYTTFDYELDVLDLEPPETSITVTPRTPDGIDGWYITAPKIALQSESGATIRYQIDGGPVQLYGVPFYLTDGIHNISYWSMDRHDNMEEKRYLDIKSDTIAPQSTINVEPDLPEDQWLTTAPLIMLTTDHPNSVMEYHWNNDDFEPYTGPFFAPEGENVLYWRAVDQAGNYEQYHSRRFMVDTQPPHMYYSIYPKEPDGVDGWYVTNPQVSLTSEDAKMMYYALDNADLQPYMAPITVPDGEKKLRFVCVDQAGNLGNETRLEFKVDTGEPELFGMFDGLEYTPENSSRWINIPPILTLTSSEDHMTINYTINRGKSLNYENPFEIPEGENEIEVRGMDRAGNTAESLFYLVKVDKRAPFVEHSFSHASGNGWFNDFRAAVELKLVEEDNRSSQVRIYYRWNTEPESLYRGSVEIPEGINSFQFWAEDLAGNTMEPRTIQTKKDSTLPLIYLTTEGLGNGTLDQGGKITIDLTGSSDESGIAAYSFDIYGTGLNWVAEGVLEHSFNEPGTYDVVVSVRDSAGNIRNETFTVVVKEVHSGSPGQNGGDSNGALLLVLALGAGLIILIIVMGMVFLLVKGRDHPHHELHLPPGTVKPINGSPPVHHLPPGVKPPPSPPRPPKLP